jgi:hypothetical protein
MVVLMEEFGGLPLKRKGADEPALFPLSCRATKMRRLACPDGGQHNRHRQDHVVAASGGVGVRWEVDVPMGDAAPTPAAGEEEKAMVLYGGDGPGASAAAESAPRIRPCGASVRVGADDWVRAMLREADGRTVRELLADAQKHGDDLALAVVPWVPPPPAEEAEPSMAAEAADGDDCGGAAAMDVEEGDDGHGRRWTGQTFGGEGYAYRWPQHCMAPPQLPVLGQESPVMRSW